MPTYSFKNKETGEVFDKLMSYSSKVEYLENNPHLESYIDRVGFIGGVSMDSGRLPEGYKDKLRLIKEKHPKARGVDHLI